MNYPRDARGRFGKRTTAHTTQRILVLVWARSVHLLAPRVQTCGFQEFSWEAKDFAHGNLSLSIASETYSVELDRHGAVLHCIFDGKAVCQYPENVWVRISESAARTYYEIADVADIIVVRRSFEGQRIEQSGRTIYDRFGASRYIPDEKPLTHHLGS